MTKSWRQAAVGLALVVLGVFLARTANAEAKARLVYARGSGTAECPTEITLRLAVIARLGYDPFSPEASRVVLARIERRRASLVGVVELVDQDGLSSGRRELSAPRRRCDELSRAMALSISLSVDPERTRVTQGSPGGDDSGSVAPLPVAPQPGEGNFATPAHAARTPKVYAGATLAGAMGLLPGAALGGGADLGTRWGAYALQVEGRLMHSFAAPMPGGGTLNGSTLASGLTGCRSFEPLGICLVTQLGVAWLRSHDERYPRSVVKLHATLGPRLLLYFARSGQLSWAIGLEGLTNLSIKNVRMHARDVWTAPPVSGTLLVGAEGDFL